MLVDWLRHYWWAVAGAPFFLYSLVTGLRTGKAELLFSTVRKSDDAALYWYGIILTAMVLAGDLFVLVHSVA